MAVFVRVDIFSREYRRTLNIFILSIIWGEGLLHFPLKLISPDTLSSMVNTTSHNNEMYWISQAIANGNSQTSTNLNTKQQYKHRDIVSTVRQAQQVPDNISIKA